MEVKWPNVVAFGFAIIAVILAVRHRDELSVALGGLGHMGPASTPDEQFYGFLVLGLLLITLVVIVRLIVSAGGKDRDR